MGLTLDTIKDTISFWRGYLKEIIEYQLIFLLFYALGFSLIIWPSLNLLISGAPLRFSNILYLISSPNLILVIIGLIVVFLAQFTQTAGYSLFFYQLEKYRKVNLLETIKGSIKKIHKIIATVILVGLVIFGAIALSFFPLFLFSFIPSFEIFALMIVIVLALIVLGVYVAIRLSISIPILMIEGRGCIESIKKSWKTTKGKVIRIALATFAIGVIAAIINYAINFVASLVLFEAGFIATIVLNLISYIFIQPLSAFVPTIIYYNLRTEV